MCMRLKITCFTIMDSDLIVFRIILTGTDAKFHGIQLHVFRHFSLLKMNPTPFEHKVAKNIGQRKMTEKWRLKFFILLCIGNWRMTTEVLHFTVYWELTEVLHFTVHFSIGRGGVVLKNDTRLLSKKVKP